MPQPGGERWQIDDLIIDVGGQVILRDGQAVPLPKLSFNFLMALVHAAPNVVSVDELMNRVWAGLFVNDETVTQRAKLLRDALGDDPKNPRYFKARRGFGYQLVPMPRSLQQTSNPIRKRLGKGQRARSIIGATVLLAMLSGAGIVVQKAWLEKPAVATSPRVLVLPFEDLSSSPSDDYIGRSIAEMVINRLSRLRGLTVLARDTSLLGVRSATTPEKTAAELNVGYIVRGSVQREGQMLRVTSSVLETASGSTIWSERFDWRVARLYALQDHIAEKVATSIETKVSGLGELPQNNTFAANPEAYLAYLKGTSLLGRYSVKESDAAAVQFERAVRLDPEQAPALAALFDAKMQSADLRKDNLAATRLKYQHLLEKALELEPDSGPALFAKAMWSDTSPEERRKLYRRASELDPANTRGLLAYVEFLERSAGPTQGAGSAGSEGRSLLKRVLAIDPLNPRARWWAIQRKLGRNGGASRLEGELRGLLQLDPDFYLVAQRYARYRWLVDGQTAEAIERTEKVVATDPENPLGPYHLAVFYLDVGDPTAARAAALTTPASRDASRMLLAQYAGDWRTAGEAALGPRGFIFNQFENWNWSEAVRDYALRTHQYDRGIRAISKHFDLDAKDPQVTYLAQIHAAPALAHILLAKGDRIPATRLLNRTVEWIDGNYQFYGPTGLLRYKAEALMLLGNQTEALKTFRASVVAAHDIRHWWYEIDQDPVWEPVRKRSDFATIGRFVHQAAASERQKLDKLRRVGEVAVRSAQQAP